MLQTDLSPTQVSEGWGGVYVYCWDAFDNGLVEWPGTRITEVDENGYFTCNIPGDVGPAWPGAAATKVSSGVFTIDAPEGATHYIINNNVKIYK